MKNLFISILFILIGLSCKKNESIKIAVKDTIKPIITLDSLVNGQKIKAFDQLKMNGMAMDNVAIQQLHIHVTDITHNISVYHDRIYTDAKHIQYEKYFVTDTNIEYHIQIAAFDSVLNLSTIDIVVNTL